MLGRCSRTGTNKGRKSEAVVGLAEEEEVDGSGSWVVVTDVVVVEK